MKHKVINIVTMIAAIITIVTSVLYLAKEIMIPGLSPFSLAVVMLGLVYNTKIQFDEGEASKGRWRFTLYLGLIAAIMNIAAGISQIMVAKIK
ncbi:hypothetical protein SAMN05660297_01631 [Natronincola peptidivorans]|uniref:Uncharacterized protein n=1 Tax=Natronincola peptidivorans TaxID=426128 RepID=A0A1I0CF77_9FIRM|nr:hypothetical protein [Natronincola peptidivorans]SET18055.1 hypothetical protein SAMN05660297_01631 [Natronincola peptidivorans]